MNSTAECRQALCSARIQRLNQTSPVGYDFGFMLGVSIAISGGGVGGGAVASRRRRRDDR
jgi:hypothetical protein